jgi:glycosyltransferase involved in cell wall biosynthesis
MRDIVLLVPGSLDSRTGGYEYDRRIAAGLRARGWSIQTCELDGSFPRPSPEARRTAAEVLAAVPDGALVIIDGLAFGAMPEEAERESARLRLIALVHHPLALETGLDRTRAGELYESERRAIAAARCVIVTSRATAGSLVPYGVPPGRVWVVEPGTDRRPLAHGSRGTAVHLICVATLTPRKGHDVLMRALAKVRGEWFLRCVGSSSLDPATTARLRRSISTYGLSDRVEIIGEVAPFEVATYYDRSDVFVLPTFHEGYGMAVAEALAHGLPVISTPTGAIPELVGEEAGLLVTPGDDRALADTVERVILDPVLRGRLVQGARRVRERLPTWQGSILRLEEVLERTAADEHVQR